MNQYFNDKLSLFFTEVSFDTSEENQLSYFQKWLFFQNSLLSHEPYNEVKCRLKIETISELLIKQKIEFKFVLFSSPQTLPFYLHTYHYVSYQTVEDLESSISDVCCVSK